MSMFLRASVLILVITTALPAQPKIEPEAPIDYLPLSIYRSYWDEDQVSGRMFPWFGEKVAFLTLTPEIDSALMGRFVQVLDRTWAYYEQLHRGHHPEDNWNLRDKPVIAAIPDHDPMLTCDLWCARVGCNGLEVIGFYQTHVPDFIEYPNRFDLDYLEGLGLNWFPYGGRHGLFDIGYARFLGYLAYEELGIRDVDENRASFVRDMEATYAESSVPFYEALTGSKHKRIVTGLDNRKVPHSGPNSVYASIMLKLRREHGGPVFHRRFYETMQQLPRGDARTAEGRHRQAVNWARAICVAAREDLTGLLTSRWRFPLREEDMKEIRAALEEPRNAKAPGPAGRGERGG